MTANYYCCLPWDIHLQCTIMDPCTHINCRTQTVVLVPSHVRWREGNAGWNNPRTAMVTSGRLGRGVLKLRWHRVWWLSPSQGCCGTRCCYQDVLGVMGLAGVTCISEGRRKQYVKKKRLLEVCGDSAWETRLQSFSWGFSRLVSSLQSARVFLSAEELPGHLLLLLCCFSRYLATRFANWCCWTVRGGHMTQGRCQLTVPWEWVNEQASCPWDLVEVLAGVWREKQAGWSHPEPCLHPGMGVEGMLGELGSPLGTGHPQPTGAACSGSCSLLVCWGFKLEQGLLKCW